MMFSKPVFQKRHPAFMPRRGTGGDGLPLQRPSEKTVLRNQRKGKTPCPAP
ncbi:hypothetical protein NEIELOOT_01333 [Neisseria elongata subsp. glycolytica ATCC 29315]|uniref:Uncharacterized protein n=1 Tax=Neisseria elongata subsp. glycolytica ATCC 29315 TaxID=546263 RepID=D4DQJ5_NEIEG|nr:hypothetical protein NEIELOOT_01333 [Neisseria elongata subsp. glycolytica ATCC 29315]